MTDANSQQTPPTGTQPQSPTTTTTQTTDPNAASAPDPAKAVPEPAKPDPNAAKPLPDTKTEPFKVEEIKLPEGFEIDAPVAEKFTGLVNKYGLSREAVNELVSLQTDAMKAASEKGSALWDQTQDQWRAQAEKDPDIGGEKLAPTLSGISKLVDKYGTPELRGVFDLTGAGNHPEVIKFLNKMVQALPVAEGTAVSGAPAASKKSLEDRLYPTQGS